MFMSSFLLYGQTLSFGTSCNSLSLTKLPGPPELHRHKSPAELLLGWLIPIWIIPSLEFSMIYSQLQMK